jgi:hypothetical protein
MHCVTEVLSVVPPVPIYGERSLLSSFYQAINMIVFIHFDYHSYKLVNLMQHCLYF